MSVSKPDRASSSQIRRTSGVNFVGIFVDENTMSSSRPESRIDSRPKKTTYENVKQGIKQLYPPESSAITTNLEYASASFFEHC